MALSQEIKSAKNKHSFLPIRILKNLYRDFKKFTSYIKENKKKLFWHWVAYQFIKGVITTSFIWIPLIFAI